MVGALLLGFCVIGAWAGGPPTVNDALTTARHALDAQAVQAFDSNLSWVNQSLPDESVAGASAQVNYTINGPDAGAKSSIEYRIYKTQQEAAAHANPDVTQQKQEANQNDMPHGNFRTYHSSLTGSPLAKDVPQTFRCVALAGKGPWSRCYYYPGGDSTTVVVGTTTSAQANEAIMITALGAQALKGK
jgi:hypothetical protein